jgi:hypothetical protein
LAARVAGCRGRRGRIRLRGPFGRGIRVTRPGLSALFRYRVIVNGSLTSHSSQVPLPMTGRQKTMTR